MTIDQITEAIQPFKTVSRRQVIRYLNALEIIPLGHKQRPQQYPDSSAARVLSYLGYVPPLDLRFPALNVTDASSIAKNGAKRGAVIYAGDPRYGKSAVKAALVPTLRQLQTSRKKARAGK